MTIIEQAEAYNGLERGDINGYPVTHVVCRKSRRIKGWWIVNVNPAIVTPSGIYEASDPQTYLIPCKFEDSSVYAEIVASAEYPVYME